MEKKIKQNVSKATFMGRAYRAEIDLEQKEKELVLVGKRLRDCVAVEAQQRVTIEILTNSRDYFRKQVANLVEMLDKQQGPVVKDLERQLRQAHDDTSAYKEEMKKQSKSAEQARNVAIVLAYLRTKSVSPVVNLHGFEEAANAIGLIENLGDIPGMVFAESYRLLAKLVERSAKETIGKPRGDKMNDEEFETLMTGLAKMLGVDPSKVR